jgi:hypothetical protein
MEKLIFAGLGAFGLSIATLSTASATDCRAFQSSCEAKYHGPDPQACQKAAADCMKTCRFVGPTTGRAYTAVGTGKCAPGKQQ